MVGTPNGSVVLTGPVARSGSDGDLPGDGIEVIDFSMSASVGSNSEGEKTERNNFDLHDGSRNDWRTR